MNKRGSHVGIILSFVLFVTAIIFLYDFISPAITFGEDKNQILTEIEEKIPQDFEGELYNLKISITESCCEESDCVFVSFSKDSSVKNMNIIVKDKDDNILDSYSDNGKVYVKITEDKFFNMFFTNEDADNQSKKIENCEDLDNTQYTLASTIKTYYFEKKIKNFSLYIEDTGNYEKVKDNLSIPTGTEFSFVFISKNGSRYGKEVSDVKTNILVDSMPIYYLNSSLDLNQGYFEIGVW